MFALLALLWCWDVPQTTHQIDGYRLYWSQTVAGERPVWSTSNAVDVTTSCTNFDPPDPPPGQIVYYCVTALTPSGEGPKEH